MKSIEVVKKGDYSEADHVDAQYEYLQENKAKGITFEGLARHRRQLLE